MSGAVARGAQVSVTIRSSIFWVYIRRSVCAGVCLIAVAIGYISGQTEIIPVLIGLSAVLIFTSAARLLNRLIIRRPMFWAFMVGDLFSFA
jgi:uncharacterized membrane protein